MPPAPEISRSPAEVHTLEEIIPELEQLIDEDPHSERRRHAAGRRMRLVDQPGNPADLVQADQGERREDDEGN